MLASLRDILAPVCLRRRKRIFMTAAPVNEPRLPLDIMELILRQLRMPDEHATVSFHNDVQYWQLGTLATLCRTSSSMANLAYPELYRSVIVEGVYRFLPETDWRKLHRFAGYEIVRKHVDNIYTGDGSILALIERLHLARQPEGNLARCVNLQHLTIGLSRATQAIDATLIGDEMSSLKFLTSVCLDFRGADEKHVIDYLKACIFGCAHIKRLELRGLAEFSQSADGLGVSIRGYRNNLRQDKWHKLQLSHLTLRDPWSIHVLAAIVFNLDPRSLQHLDIEAASPGESVRWIIKAGWPVLRSLSYVGAGPTTWDCELDREALQMLIESPELHTLRYRVEDIQLLRILPGSVRFLQLHISEHRFKLDLLWLLAEFAKEGRASWFSRLKRLEIHLEKIVQLDSLGETLPEAAQKHNIGIIFVGKSH